MIPIAAILIGNVAALAVVILITAAVVRYTRRGTMPKPPSTPQELEDSRLATEGYTVPAPGAPQSAQPTGRWPSAGADVVGARSPARTDAFDDAPEHFTVPASSLPQSKPIQCENCGSGWFAQAHHFVTGPRKAEREPGVGGIYICAACTAIFQEIAPNQFERVRFVDGRLTR